MSSKVKGIAEIELKSDRFTGPAQKAKSSLTQLGTQGKQSIEKIATGADRAKQSMSSMSQSATSSMQQVGRAATQAGTQVTQSAGRGVSALNTLGVSGTRAGQQITTGMTQAATATRQMTAATNQAGVSMGVMTLGVAALGTSIGTTFTGMSNLNKAHLKQNKAIQKVAKVTVGLARANDLLSSTQLAVQRFTISVAKFEDAGLQSTDAYTIAKANLTLQLQKLKTAQDDYQVKLADIRLAEDDSLQIADDLQDTYINMTISISNTVLMSAFLAKTLVPNLSRAWIVNKFHILANSKAMLFFRGTIIKSIFNVKQFRIALIGATFGLRGLATGVRAFMLALGPLGIAMIAIGVLWELWETNAFGFRDALQEVWTWLKKILPILALLETLVLSVFPPAEEAIDETGQAAKETAGEFENLEQTTEDLAAEMEAGLIPDLDTLEDGFAGVTAGAGKAGKALDEFKKKRESLSQKVSEDQSESFADTLFGLNGIFSQTGRLLGGFRGQPLTVTIPGTRKAIALAMEKFGITREAAEILTKRTIEARSRVLTGRGVGRRPVGLTSGGRISIAVNTIIQSAGRASGLARAILNSQRGTQRGTITRDAQNAVRQANAIIDKIESAGLTIPSSITVRNPRGRTVRAPVTISIIFGLLAQAEVILAERRRLFDIKVSNFVVSANLGEAVVRQMLTTDAGERDLTNITAFQDRIKLEANLV